MMNVVPFQLCLWTVFLTSAFPANAVQEKDTRIADGEPADFHEYPFYVSLEYNKVHRCGAVILSKNWLVTAAQCLQNAKAENLRVRWGTPVRGIGGTVHQAIEIMPHHQYVFGSYDYDIALIRVSPGFVSNSSISLVDPSLTPRQGQIVSVVGWGAETSGGWLSNNLQAVEMSLMERSNCEKLYRDLGDEVTPRMICATHLEMTAHGPCTGDSGAPLMLEGRLLGLVSWGFGCANDKTNPGVFSNVQPFETWIEAVIGDTPGNW